MSEQLTKDRLQEIIDLFDRKYLSSSDLDILDQFMDEYLDKWPTMLAFFLATKNDRK